MGRLIDLGSIADDKLVLQREHLDRSYMIDKSVGAIKYGQVLALDTASGKCVKYDKASATAKGAFSVYVGDSLEATSTEDFEGSVLARGSRVDKSKLVGIDLTTDFEGAHKLYLAGIILEEVIG